MSKSSGSIGTVRNGAMAALCVASLAGAATFDVDRADDARDAMPGDGRCEATAGGGDCTLRAAVQEANAQAGPDVIRLAEGVHAIGIQGESEDAAATGDLDILDSLTIEGLGSATTILDGAGLDRVLDVPRSGGRVVVLEGLTIRGGAHGGVRFLSRGELTLRDCEVAGNDSPAAGGGIYGAGGAITLVRTVISDNAAAMQGGGIRIHGGELVLVDSDVTRNAVAGAGVEGVHASLSSVRTVRGERAEAVACAR